ncbi:hypothetical protein TVAG_583070 [Trichomonas vaginalis G3]|uniref:Uncharacterized protein n=2 Tax=Trichomonas vaginalis (strain ATCC PRA-98 / G3) TaxID=412133 RepID=A2GCW5_TRIV3|nr:proteasome regulatory particle [Trichomonas vaginalis G3]EAX85005.1 hypothetical protein TVAG_583070 [Trichomonas vaginalis G3]KAI5543357.1 proteasome regulatory particle [Trichomonas vaginalis G3]|eukprot:XP_001297935.1 hypothetical protein [Trichomonas vaginalis G3]
MMKLLLSSPRIDVHAKVGKDNAIQHVITNQEEELYKILIRYPKIRLDEITPIPSNKLYRIFKEKNSLPPISFKYEEAPIIKNYKDEEDDNYQLFDSVSKNDETNFLELLKNIKDINNLKGWFDFPLLLFILMKNNRHFVDILFGKYHSLDPNIMFNKLPLISYLIKRKRGENMALYFLDKTDKIDINKPDEDGMTPLHYAVISSACKVIKKLLEFDYINPNAKDSRGQTPIMLASRMPNNSEPFKLLFQCDKVDKQTRDKRNATILHNACQVANVEIISMIIEKINEIPDILNYYDNERKTPFHRIIEYTQYPERRLIVFEILLNIPEFRVDILEFIKIVPKLENGNELTQTYNRIRGNAFGLYIFDHV